MKPTSVISAASKLSRGETVATRMTFEEVIAVDAAAAAGGITRSAWLRDAAVEYLQRPGQTPRVSTEPTILEEVMALRLLLVNLFPAAIQGLQVDAVRQIMQFADSVKGREAARVLGHSTKNQL